MAKKITYLGDIAQIGDTVRVEETIPLRRANPKFDAAKDHPSDAVEVYTEWRVYQLTPATPEEVEERGSDAPIWRLRGAHPDKDAAMAAGITLADKE